MCFYIKDDNTSWESEPLKNLAKEGELKMYKHNGFWQCMDTKRDKDFLEKNLKIINQEELIDLMQKHKFQKCSYRNFSNGIVSIHSGWKV